MTLADRIEAVILEHGPMPVCELAPAVKKQKAEVIAALNTNPDRFVHNGMKARASRWDVRREVHNGVPRFESAVSWPDRFEEAEEALVALIRLRRQTPEEALVRIVSAWAAAA
jgi:hypothetical protein